MGKLFKVVGGLLLALVLLVAVAAIILPMIVDPNDYKGEIIAQVKEQTGRDLTIDGDLDLSVFPWLGLEIGGLVLSNAEGFGDKPFAVIDSAAVRVKLIPLLSRQLEVDTIGLKGLSLNLVKSKTGENNWDDLIKTATAEEKTTPSEPGVGLEGFVIGGLDISDANIIWDDRSTGQHYVVDQLSLNSGAIRPGTPVDLKLEAQLESNEPALTADLELDSEVSLDEQASMLRIKGLVLTVDVKSPLLQQGELKAVLKADVGLALSGQSVTVDGLNLTADELKLTGNLKGSNLNSEPVFIGALNLAEFNLRQWLEEQGITVPETADSKVLSLFAASLELSSKGQATELKQLVIGLDDTRITGNARVVSGAIGFDLNVDTINLDRYLPPKQEGDGLTVSDEGASKEAAAPADEPLLPVEALRSLKLNGTLKIGEMIVNKLTAREIVVQVKADKGRLSLDNKVGAFYAGGLSALVNLNVAGKTPLMQLDTEAKNIQAGPLLVDLTDKDKFDGLGNFQANLKSSGNRVNDLKRNLDGNLSFRFENGAVKGFNLAQTLREGKAKLKGESLPKSEEPLQTDFSEITASAVINDGVLHNEDLLAKSPFLRVTGAGDVNLVTEKLDYLVKPVIVSTAVGQGGEGLEELKGVPIPIKLTGNYADPEFSIEWGQVATAAQKAKLEEKKAEVEQQLEEKKQEAQEKLENKLQDKLKGLFN